MVVETIVLCPELVGPTSYDRRGLLQALSGPPVVDAPALGNNLTARGRQTAELGNVPAELVGSSRELVGSSGEAGRPTVTVVDIPAGEPGDDERTVRAHWVAYVAVQLSTSSTRGPVLLVLSGRSGALAPALGFSQRAARRQVAGYVLVDADFPAADSAVGDWPDAPVVYVASPAAAAATIDHARLRGWRLVEVSNLAPSTLATALGALLDPRP